LSDPYRQNSFPATPNWWLGVAEGEYGRFGEQKNLFSLTGTKIELQYINSLQWLHMNNITKIKKKFLHFHGI
jgi:hypothetical protein